MTKLIFSQKQVLIASLVVTAIVGMMMPTVQAISNDPFRDGYQDGKNDYLQGNDRNASCSPYNSDSNPDLYCAIYITGYEAGWKTAWALYGNQ